MKSSDYKVTPIITVMVAEDEKGYMNPAVKKLEGICNKPYNAEFAALCCLCVYEIFIDGVPESNQLIFENAFKTIFDTVFKAKERVLQYPTE